jgi:DNA/RNA-binding domain of Phe-tRNA-synthetase-like protein
MAELRNAILTAGHDRDRLELPVRADVSLDGDRYVLLGGAETVLEAGEMLMADGTGIVSSILRGPDRRTRIVTETRGVLFAVYAPAGIGDAKVRRHLDDIRANVELIAPGARTESTIVLGS